MTGLLVSVRNVKETQAVLDSDVDLVDVKDPSRGSLGRADYETIAKIRSQVRGRLPLSVALGELLEKDRWNEAFDFAGIRFAKLGLAGCARVEDWPQQWENELQRLPNHVGRVAVAYADWQTCDAPPVDDVLYHATRLECQGLLIDTYDKQQGTLLDFLDVAQLQKIVDRCRRHHLLAVLAGSLAGDALCQAQQVEPDFIAVRGAVCAGERTCDIDAQKVRAVKAMLQSRTRVNQS
ncbi:MAG: hypothetical protein CL681_05280 [Blastopirellula sp.]|nr:hypothetical protein [Blastopirellula sp.]|tara:strand:+ start:482 stop:1189 length:708 start_codon:yes stop_codon:yes gene_type:complete